MLPAVAARKKIKRAVRIKVYYDRSGPYINYVRNLMVIAVAYKVYEDAAIGRWIYSNRYWVIPVILVSYVLGRIIIGFTDKRMRIREYELEEYNRTNPDLQDIKSGVTKILNKLDENNSVSNDPGQGGKP